MSFHDPIERVLGKLSKATEPGPAPSNKIHRFALLHHVLWYDERVANQKSCTSPPTSIEIVESLQPGGCGLKTDGGLFNVVL